MLETNIFSFFLFSDMFSTSSETNFNYLVVFNLPFVNELNLDQSKLLSCYKSVLSFYVLDILAADDFEKKSLQYVNDLHEPMI